MPCCDSYYRFQDTKLDNLFVFQLMTIYLERTLCYLFNWAVVLFLIGISLKFCWQRCFHSHTNFVYYNHMGNMDGGGGLIAKWECRGGHWFVCA